MTLSSILASIKRAERCNSPRWTAARGLFRLIEINTPSNWWPESCMLQIVAKTFSNSHFEWQMSLNNSTLPSALRNVYPSLSFFIWLGLTEINAD